jgi:hypothetical protein
LINTYKLQSIFCKEIQSIISKQVPQKSQTMKLDTALREAVVRRLSQDNNLRDEEKHRRSRGASMESLDKYSNDGWKRAFESEREQIEFVAILQEIEGLRETAVFQRLGMR